MSYAALTAAWGSSNLPSTAVIGTPLTSTMTTQQKLTNINAWTISGSIPTSITSSGATVANCINYGEFKALTATQQANILALLNSQGQLLGGSTNTGKLLVGMLLDYFGAGSTTIAALTALAVTLPQPWWQVSTANGGGGLTSPVSGSDLVAAGNLS